MKKVIVKAFNDKGISISEELKNEYEDKVRTLSSLAIEHLIFTSLDEPQNASVDELALALEEGMREDIMVAQRIKGMNVGAILEKDGIKKSLINS